MARKTGKECAQTAVAAAIASGGNKELTKTLIRGELTREETGRAMKYLASGQKVTGPTS